VKKALVTGSAGFVGRHMKAELLARGWRVSGVDIAQHQDALLSFRYMPQCDLFVHAAASQPHRAAIDGDATHLIHNLRLDSAAFEWAVRTGTPMLYLSSSAVYPAHLQARRGWVLEESDLDLDEPGAPDAGYGWTKLTGEKMAAAARTTGLKVTVVRPASGCGSDQSDLFPFMAIAKRVAAKEAPLTIWGPRDQTRDFIHISDVVRGALAVVDSGTEDPVNLCTGVGTTMGDLAELMWRTMHGTLDEFAPKYDETKPTGVFHRVLDPTAMRRYYTPRVSLEEMVADAARTLGY
jgi:nucleoside-diphosphate-sugar epimerase